MALSAGFLRRSLTLWERREAYRKRKHTEAQAELERARRDDVHPRQHLVDRRDKWSRLLADARAMIERREHQIAALASPRTWHPGATRAPYSDAGPFVTGKPKLVWHTTEGSSLPAYSNSAPHFTLNPKTGQLWQHIPINRAAKTLKHPAGTVETNRANAIQVELIGFARDTDNWPRTYYAPIANLARWIEVNARVPRRCGVKFFVGTARLQGQAWLNYSGHCGHSHAPHNDHWDPGAFQINHVI